MQPPATPTPIRRATARGRALIEPRDEYWQRLGVAITIAGGVYPVILGLTVALLSSPFIVVTSLQDPGGVLFAITAVIATSIFGVPFFFGAGFIYTGLYSLFLTPLVAGTLKLLDEDPPRDRVGVLTGSLVAFVATFPYWLMLGGSLGGDFDVIALLFGYGLLTLAVVTGQWGGLSVSVADARRRRRGRLRKPPFRLTIWRMLAAMIPLSIAMSLLSRAELLTVPTAVAMLAAGVTAYLASWPVTGLFHRWADRRCRLRRAKRST